MDVHDCKPPREVRPIEDNRWTCPDCGTEWEARATGQGYRFRNPDDPESGPEGPVTWAEWYRIED